MVGDLFRYDGLNGKSMPSPVLYDVSNAALIFTDRDVENIAYYCKVTDAILFGFIKEGSVMNRNSLWGKEVSWM